MPAVFYQGTTVANWGNIKFNANIHRGIPLQAVKCAANKLRATRPAFMHRNVLLFKLYYNYVLINFAIQEIKS